MDDQEKALLQNIKEFYEIAVEADKKSSFNSAVTLYFKALAVCADLFILRVEQIIPANHTERFRILEEKYKDLYIIIDKDFMFYQNSYRIKLDKEASEVLRKDVERLFKLLKITKR